MTVHIEKAHGTKVKIYPCVHCDIVFGEKHELDKHVDNHKPTKETSSGGGDNVLVDYLRRVAVQQELIITKLNKLETKMDGEFIDIRNYLHGDKTKATVNASSNTENLNDNGTM